MRAEGQTSDLDVKLTGTGVYSDTYYSATQNLSEEALKTIFEPTITFKARGMGLGLSIARKDALVCGGDLLLIDGKLGGAGFRLVLARNPV